MKKIFLVLISVMAMAVAGNTVFASCSSSIAFGHTDITKLFVSPGAAQLDVTLFGEWWAYNFGKATVGVGDDRGVYAGLGTGNTTYDWLVEYVADGTSLGWFSVGDWGNNGTDNCIYGAPGAGPMVMLVEDTPLQEIDGTAQETDAYFAVGCIAVNTDYEPRYDFSRGSISGPENLVAIPAFTVDSMTKVGDAYAVDLSWLSPVNGFYIESLTTLGIGNILKKYEVYARPAPLGTDDTLRSAAVWPSSYDVDGDGTAENNPIATVLADLDADGTVDVESSATVTVTGDTFLALRLVFEGTAGVDPFKTRYVGKARRIGGVTEAGGFDSVSVGYLGRKAFSVNWTTSGEFAVSGFNVLRADTANGPFYPVNASLVPAMGQGGAGASYTYIDLIQKPAGQFAFWYKIEMVSSGDLDNVYSDVVKGTMKEKGPK